MTADARRFARRYVEGGALAGCGRCGQPLVNHSHNGRRSCPDGPRSFTYQQTFTASTTTQLALFGADAAAQLVLGTQR